MKTFKQIAFAVTLPLGLITGAAEADQLCHSDGTGCMNISWNCGDFTPSADQMCKATIAATAAAKDLAQMPAKGAATVGEQLTEEAKSLPPRKRKPKVIWILPDPK